MAMLPRAELILLAALALVFIPLEWAWPVRRVAADWRRLRVDALHVVFSGGMIRWAVAALMAGLALAAAPFAPQAVSAAVRSQPAWLQFVEILLISDFMFYTTHRIRHRVPFLWRFHEIHHSSEKLDWVAGHRVHPIDQIFESGSIAAPLMLLGFSPEPMLAYALVYRWQAVLLHSNVRVDFGPLKWIVASPHYHHWHHADQPQAYDKNFGGQLAVFDLLLGTLNLPEGLPAKYGLSTPVAKDYLGQLAHPFRGRADPATAPQASLSGS